MGPEEMTKVARLAERSKRGDAAAWRRRAGVPWARLLRLMGLAAAVSAVSNPACAARRPVKVSAFIPRDSAGMHVFDQRFVAPGYGLSASTAGPNRQVVLATRAAQGRQVIHIRFIVNRLATPEPAPRRVTARPEPAGLEGARLLAGQELLQAARSRSADERTLVAALMRAIAAPRPSDAARGPAARAPRRSAWGRR